MLRCRKLTLCGGALSVAILCFYSLGFFHPIHVKCLHIDEESERVLLNRLEDIAPLFPTFVHGISKKGNVVIYKSVIGGLTDFQRLRVAESHAYLLEHAIEQSNGQYLVVLDFAFMKRPMRIPGMGLFKSIKRDQELSEQASAKLVQLIKKHYEGCEAVLIINANRFLTIFKNFLVQLAPVQNAKVFVSSNTDVLVKHISLDQLPRPYNPNSIYDLRTSPATFALHNWANQRALLLLGRNLQHFSILKEEAPHDVSPIKRDGDEQVINSNTESRNSNDEGVASWSYTQSEPSEENIVDILRSIYDEKFAFAGDSIDEND